MVTAQRSIFRKQKALVVVLESVMSDIIETMLLSFGLDEIHKVTSAEEALIYLENYHVDVIICDQALPNLTGNELLQKIRTIPNTAALPFIMLSSSIDHKDVAFAISQGVSDYLVKPFKAQTLEKKLYHALTKPVDNRYILHSKDLLNQSRAIKNKLTILIVDDIPDNFKIISNILRQDYNLKAANNSVKALKICESDSPPDLILLDIMMPGMDGLEFCKLLKRNPFLSHISVIFTTTLDDTKHIVKGLESGAVDYITKPINASILKARVNTHCKLIQQQNLLRHQVEIMIEEAKLRANFESLVQHDLNRPITEIKKSLKELLPKVWHEPGCRLPIATLNQSTELLTQTVDGMMSLYKIDNDSLPLKPASIALSDMVKEVMITFGLSLKERKLKTSFAKTDCVIEGDTALIRSAVAKIFELCVDFAADNSDISISLSQTQQQCQLHFALKQTKPTIDIAKLSTSIEVGHDCDLNALILYSARRIIEINHGSLETDFNTGHALVFRINFNNIIS